MEKKQTILMLGQSYNQSQVPWLPGNLSLDLRLTLYQIPNYTHSTHLLVRATFCRVYYSSIAQIRKLRPGVVK